MKWKLRQNWLFFTMVGVLALTALAGVAVIWMEVNRNATNPEVSRLSGILDVGASVLCWMLILAGTYYGMLGWHQWHESRRMMTGISGAERRVMSVLCRISESNFLVYGSRPFLVMGGLSGLLAAILLGDFRWLGLLFFAGCLLWWLWVRTTTPPAVLFLSTSDAWSIEIHRQIKNIASPLRVVTLLDLQHSRQEGTADELRLDCLRTGNDDDWWKVITILMKITPLLVINADTESPGVVREARHLVMEDMTHKVMFLTRGNACLLRCEPEPAASAAKCRLARPTEVADWIVTNLDKGQLA